MKNFSLISLSISSISTSPFFSPNQGTRTELLNSKFSKFFSNFFFSSRKINALKTSYCSFSKFTDSVILVKEEQLIENQTFYTTQRLTQEYGSVTVKNCVFKDCTSKEKGGGIYVFFSYMTLIVKSTTFGSCRSAGEGGAIKVNVVTAKIENVCAYHCMCGTDKQGNSIHSSANNELKLITTVECTTSAYAMKRSSTSIVVQSDSLNMSDINDSLESSYDVGGIEIYQENITTFTRVLFYKVTCKKMFKILALTPSAKIEKTSFISCNVEESLITPSSQNIIIYDAVFSHCKGNILPHYGENEISFVNTVFDYDFKYSLLTNCSVGVASAHPLNKNEFDNCAGDVLFNLDINTKVADIVTGTLVLLVLIVALVATGLWYCIIKPPEINTRDKNEKNLKMTLPFIEEDE